MLNFIILQAPAQQQQNPWMFWGMIILLFVVMYVFMVLPQRRRQKEIEKKRAAMQPGDKVITAGGIHGIIKKVEDSAFLIEISKDTVIKVDKASVYANGDDAQQDTANQQK